MTRTRAFNDEFITALDPPSGAKHLRKIQEETGSRIHIHGNHCQVEGGKHMMALSMLDKLYATFENEGSLGDIAQTSIADAAVLWKGPRNQIKPRTEGQKSYIKDLDSNTIIVAAGPAGSGKTYLAIAHAIRSLLKDKSVERIVLTRPVVESGENLGFLPGTLEDKIDPYLRPLFDSLAECLEKEHLDSLLEKKIIEISPLAYMRGRTLKNAYVILDEGQNTTPSQMKMFLTRIGEGSKMIITGDPGQSDLRGANGLADFLKRAADTELPTGIMVSPLTHKDIVRHPLVGPLLDLYDGVPG